MSSRNQIVEFIEQGNISEQNIQDSLTVAEITPDGKSWQLFINHLLLWIGGLAIAFAGMFFIAYNWTEIGHLSKFAMVESVMIATVIAYLRLGSENISAKLSLLMATIFLGVLLALYGQTYQTGADPWQLFFNWALLMIPWALIGRFPAIWLVWILLINLSIILYYQAFRGIFRLMFSSTTDLLWILMLFNTIALGCWEAMAKTFHWLEQRWAIRLLATISGIIISWLVIYAIFDFKSTQLWPAPVWFVWMGAMYWYYRKIKPDLYMLAGVCLSAIVVIVSFHIKHMLSNGNPGSFLFLAILIIALATAAAIWLRKIHRELLS